MKNWILAISLFLSMSVQAAFVELKDAKEFNDLIQTSTVPVVVQFSAYWCGPCKNLKAVFNQVAPNFSDEKVRLAIVDAYVNTSLKSYLQGGYPTVRSFNKGQVMSPSFTGSQTASYVTNYINKVIQSANSTEDLEVGAYCPIE